MEYPFARLADYSGGFLHQGDTTMAPILGFDLVNCGEKSRSPFAKVCFIQNGDAGFQAFLKAS